MVKKIIVGTAAAFILVGCGGSGNGSGGANVYAINASPEVSSATVTANGTVVLNAAGYESASSGPFVAVNTGAGAQVFLTNASSTQLASATTTFNGGDYYGVYVYGNATTQNLAIMPLDQSTPPNGFGRLVFTNTATTSAAVDVYVTTAVSLVGLSPTVSSLTPFNSGFSTEDNNLTPNTYSVYFTSPGNQNNILGQTSVTITNGTIQVVGITDSTTSVAVPPTTPYQTVLPITSLPVESGSVPPVFGTKNVVVSGIKTKA